jgi:hypothetical protein
MNIGYLTATASPRRYIGRFIREVLGSNPPAALREPLSIKRTAIGNRIRVIASTCTNKAYAMCDNRDLAVINRDERTSPRQLPEFEFEEIIERICDMRWERLDGGEMLAIANAYYFFSVQFRENLQIACRLYPDDCKLRALRGEECHTDNLSPWPGIAEAGEQLDHDEFMRRALLLQPLDHRDDLNGVGAAYLATIRDVDALARAKSIASYEDGGLSRVFRAILRGRHWDCDTLQAFRHFLEQHIKFDADDGGGHGALSRHLSPDASVVPLWQAFEDILTVAAPRLVAGR